MSFINSTQRSTWIFPTENQLLENRANVYEKKVAAIKALVRLNPVEDESVYLTTREEQQLILAYCKRIRDKLRSKAASCPRRVIAVAASFFRRYFLANTVMDYHPYFIAAMATFVACKAEEYNLLLSELAALFNTEAAYMKRFEVKFSAQLQFHFLVHTPFRPLRGFLSHARAVFAAALQRREANYVPSMAEESDRGTAQEGGAEATQTTAALRQHQQAQESKTSEQAQPGPEKGTQGAEGATGAENSSTGAAGATRAQQLTRASIRQLQEEEDDEDEDEDEDDEGEKGGAGGAEAQKNKRGESEKQNQEAAARGADEAEKDSAATAEMSGNGSLAREETKEKDSEKEELVIGINTEEAIAAATAALDDMDASVVEQLGQDSFWVALGEAASEKALLWWFTDVQFLFPPSQIALAVFTHALEERGVETAAYVQALVEESRHEDHPSMDTMTARLQEIRRVAQRDLQQLEIDAATEKSLLERLEVCRNPFFNPNSEEYRRKLQEQEWKKSKRKAADAEEPSKRANVAKVEAEA